MIGAGDIIADRFRRMPAEEDAARVAQAGEQRFGVFHRQLHMLGGQPIG